MPLWALILVAPLWTLVSPALALIVMGGLVLAGLAGAAGAFERRFAVVTLAVLFGWGILGALNGGVSSFATRYSEALAQTRPRRNALRRQITGRRLISRSMASLAQRLVSRRREGEVIHLIATQTIGRLGFDAQLPVLDIVGLTDAEVARGDTTKIHEVDFFPGHFRSNPDYIFSRHPDYIIIQHKDSGHTLIPALRDIWNHPDLERYYEWDNVIRAYRRR